MWTSQFTLPRPHEVLNQSHSHHRCAHQVSPVVYLCLVLPPGGGSFGAPLVCPLVTGATLWEAATGMSSAPGRPEGLLVKGMSSTQDG